jgi:hypothetical protein
MFGLTALELARIHVLLPPDEIAAEIVENFETALERFKRVAASFASSGKGWYRHKLGSPHAADATGGVIHVPRLWCVEGGENLRRAESCRRPISGRHALQRWSG